MRLGCSCRLLAVLAAMNLSWICMLAFSLGAPDWVCLFGKESKDQTGRPGLGDGAPEDKEVSVPGTQSISSPAALSTLPASLATPLRASGRNRNRRLIIDVGFNEGGDAYHYLSHGFDVIGVEANPNLVKQARQHQVFRDFIDSGQLILLQTGIAESNKSELIFWEHPKSTVWGQLGEPHPQCKARRAPVWGQLGEPRRPTENVCIAHRVPMMTCQEVLDRFGVPLYLKVDIERQDVDCLMSLVRKNPCQLPFYLSFERNSNFTGAMKHLGYLGYRYFKQTLQLEWNQKHKVTSIKQASGPFGEWAMDFKHAHLWKYSDTPEHIFGHVRKRREDDWIDVHARLDGQPTVCKETSASI